MLSVGNIQVEEEVWGVYDNRLPDNVQITRTPPDDAFLESINEVQLQPIGIGIVDDQIQLLFGRKRLLALRMLSEKQEVERSIRVNIFYGLSSSDSYIISLLENNQRSSNEISDYESVRYFLHEGLNYKEIAKATGMTVGTIKALDRKWADVPQWAVQGCLDGKIAPSTAIEVGRVGTDVQKTLKKEYNKEGKLSGTRVKEEKRFIQQEQLATMSDSLGLNVTVRDFYSRAELKDVLKIVKSQSKAKAVEYIQSLLNS
jgi:hypothetical protein